jgi:hypothetical protein
VNGGGEHRAELGEGGELKEREVPLFNDSASPASARGRVPAATLAAGGKKDSQDASGHVGESMAVYPSSRQRGKAHRARLKDH